MSYKISYNQPFLVGNELAYIEQAIASGKISGNGNFTKKCHAFFQEHFGFRKCLMTSSCTDALEMCALLLDIQPDDEVIMPTYTFVSTANAFILRGAKIVFADSQANHPNIDVDSLEALITEKTKAIIVVHYAGMACEMETVMNLAEKHGLFVVEDAAHALDNSYKNRPLGGIGHLATLSFHETKNVIAGEGGMLIINDERFVERAEIIWEKGTNRSAFFRGEINKYNWVDVGSSFLPSEITAAFLFAQLEHFKEIHKKRRAIWVEYYERLIELEKTGLVQLPKVPTYTTQNGHIFYLICQNKTIRDGLIAYLKEQRIMAVFHYLALHCSPFFNDKHDGRTLANAERYTDCLVRLPLFFELTAMEQTEIVEAVLNYFERVNEESLGRVEG